MHQSDTIQTGNVRENETPGGPSKRDILRHFSRITTRGRVFIPQIDGLRCVAIIAVLAYHVQKISSFHFGQAGIEPTDLVSRFFLAGSYGVPLFFMISGFVLALPFARAKLADGKPVSLPSYYLRRLTRLEPPYLIHLIILFLLTWLIIRKQPTHPELLHNPEWATYVFKHILPSVFYAHGFIFGEYPYPNIVLWSLEVEVQFYMIAPFLATVFFFSKMKRRILLAVLMTGIPLLMNLAPPQLPARIMLLGNLQYFLGGLLLVDLYLMDSLRTTRNTIWDVLFLIACGGIIFFPAKFLLPWLVFIVCVAAFKGSLCFRILSNPWIATTGGMCYTIYMYHSIMISSVIRITKNLQTHVLWFDYLVQMLILSALILPACSLLFLVTERPFMQRHWPAKWWGHIKQRCFSDIA